MKKMIMLAALLLISCQVVMSQKSSVTGVKKVSVKNVSPIMENNEVKGYYFFYYKDKASKGISNYGLMLYNNNFEETHNIDITKPSNSMMLEGSYNGTHFCFSFLNQKGKFIEYQIYDLNGKDAGSYKVDDLSNAEIQWYASMVQSEEDEFSGGIMPVPSKGFVRYGMEKEGGYRACIEYFDNTGKKQWTTEPFSTTKKSYETTEPVYADDKIVVTNIFIREKALSTDGDSKMIAHNISDGKKKFEFALTHANGILVPMGLNYDKDASQYISYGEYYAKKGKDEKIDVKNKIGFYLQIFDENGKLVKESFSSWEKDIAAVIPVNKKGKLDNNAYVFVHNVVKTAEGKYYAIGEQFKKAVSGKGIAMNLAANALGGSSNAAMTEIEMMDMMVFEFDADLKPTKATIIEKEKSEVVLQKGMSTVSVHKLGFMMKMMGYFDYAFTTESVDRTSFNAVYINYDRDKKAGTNSTIGSITLNKSKEIETKKIQLNTKPTRYLIMPAKSGYLAIFEYHKKEKTVDFRLEKLE